MRLSKHSHRRRGLIAVLLLTRSRSGSRLVFHYPARPESNDPRRQDRPRNDSDSNSDSSEDEEDPTTKPNPDSNKDDTVTHDDEVAATEEVSLRDGSEDVANGTVLGFSTDSLEKLLSPGRWSDRKRFEVRLDGLTFVGCPVYAAQDGTWASHDHLRGEDARAVVATTSTLEKHNLGDATYGSSTLHTNVTIVEPKLPERPVHDFSHVPESLDSQRGLSLGTSMNSMSTNSGVLADQMTMFHVVFATSSVQGGDALQIYNGLAKKISKALHYCQQQRSHVAVESGKLLALKAKAKMSGIGDDVLWTQMLETSELAWALKEVYEKTAAGEVAGFRLNGMEMSLQVKDQSFAVEHNEAALHQHSALLLLEEKEALLGELAHREASPFVHLIQNHTPTKSLYKLAMNLNMPLDEVLYLARHLTKWRKARVIAPLHPRNIYTLDPEAPIDSIVELMPVYSRQFAALPPLPQILKMVGSKPIQYGSLIPSKNHRSPYMDILAFLVRHKFVAQLKTFGWLKTADYNTAATSQPGGQHLPNPPISALSLLSPHQRPADEDAVDVGSERASIPVSALAATQTVPPETHEPGRCQGLVLDPLNATEAESALLRRVSESMGKHGFHERLGQLLPYLDGEHALEEIAAMEGMKRSRVDEWLALLHREGHLLTFNSL